MQARANRTNNHFFTATTSEMTDTDEKLNACGITGKHSYPILDFIYLNKTYDNGQSETKEKLFMLMDPRGEYARTRSNKKWNANDTVNWTENY